jgi:NADH:ubiquinone oxidoreductase subunit 3 (subunit A)
MTVGELLGGGFSVLKRRPKELLIWSVIQLLVSAALFALIIRAVSTIFLGLSGPGSGAMENGQIQAFASVFGTLMLAYVLILIWWLMLFTAVVRATANAGEDKFAWLRFAGDEFRLIGLGFLYFVGMLIVSFVLSAAIGLLAVLIAGGNAANLGVFGIILNILFYCGFAWLFIRLSLVGSVFVLEKNFALRKGWQATKRHFWTLFLTYLIMGIAFIVLELIIILLMSPALVSTMFSGAAAAPQAFEQQRQFLASLNSPGIGMILIWIVGTIIGTAVIVYYYSVTATAAISATGYSKQDLAELSSHFE